MLALLVVGTANVLSTLDLFVVNLAFSSLHRSFPGTTNQALSWVLSAYSILFAAVLVPAGRMGDRYGRKRVFRIGLVVFGVASAMCALAPDVAALVAARALKGVGAALMVPSSLGLLLASSPRDKHTKMVAIWSATGSVAAALGPVVGGALVELSWRLIFVINVPLAALAVWQSARLEDSPRSTSAPPDLLGSVLLVLGIGALAIAVTYAPEWGFLSTASLGAALGSVVLLGAFVRRCLRHPSPALDLRIFRSKAFLGATMGMAIFYAGFAIMLLGGTLFLTSVWGWNPLRAGEAFAIGPATAVVSALTAARLGVAPRRLVLFGSACFLAASVYWWRFLDAEPAWLAHYLPASMLFGAGAGVAQTGFIAGGTGALPASDYATGSAVLTTARQIGAALGVAIFVALAGTATMPSQYASAWLAIAVLASVGAACGAWARRA